MNEIVISGAGTSIPQTIINQRDALKTEFFSITNTLY